MNDEERVGKEGQREKKTRENEEKFTIRISRGNHLVMTVASRACSEERTRGRVTLLVRGPG